jgi:hypothetical protein
MTSTFRNLNHIAKLYFCILDSLPPQTLACASCDSAPRRKCVAQSIIPEERVAVVNNFIVSVCQVRVLLSRLADDFDAVCRR